MTIRTTAMIIAIAVAFHSVAHADAPKGDAAPRLIAETSANLSQSIGPNGGDALLRDAEVTVSYDIDALGHVTGARVVGSVHANGQVLAAALKVVSSRVFEPALRNGAPVGTENNEALVIFRADK